MFLPFPRSGRFLVFLRGPGDHRLVELFRKRVLGLHLVLSGVCSPHREGRRDIDAIALAGFLGVVEFELVKLDGGFYA